jgi:hypothetical protein
MHVHDLGHGVGDGERAMKPGQGFLRTTLLEETVLHHHLSVYLNDHLAISSSALALLTELRKVNDLEDWAERTFAEIAEDRFKLEQLMVRLGITLSTMRQATAWIAEKVADAKARLDDEREGALARLELLEGLAMGIDGKRALWTSLQTIAARVPGLENVDFAGLIARAEQQRQEAETRRLEAAAAALRA